MSSRLPWIIVAAAVAAALGLWLGARLGEGSQLPPSAMAGALVYPPRQVPEFKLTRPDGSALEPADLRGAWTLLFFGYSHCPDVCPTTLAILKQVDALLKTDPPAQPVRMLFVSVDPERDSGPALAEYVGYFSPHIIAATGEPVQLQALTAALGVVYMKAPQSGTDYNIDHSASLLVLDPQARLHALFRPPLDPGVVAADLRVLATGAGP
jgi:protein SCO1/2